MDSWFSLAFILGAVQGLTEFLPISSTGHLIITGHLLNFTGAKASTFDVAIQLGSILAVVVLYWKRFWGLLFPPTSTGFAGIRGICLLIVTSLPASILGLLLHSVIKQLFTPANVMLSLTTGAIMMLIVEEWSKRYRPICWNLDKITPKMALAIGCCQCMALWPGFSRSASTIMGGMIFGIQRSTAAEYSFIAAVPIMFAATGYDVLKSWSFFTVDDLPLFSTGMLFAFLFACLAIRTFITLLSRITLRPFAIYRLILAIAVYYFLVQN